MDNFYKKLKFYFKNANLTQKDIAEKLNISSVMVSYYLNGQP